MGDLAGGGWRADITPPGVGAAGGHRHVTAAGQPPCCRRVCGDRLRCPLPVTEDGGTRLPTKIRDPSLSVVQTSGGLSFREITGPLERNGSYYLRCSSSTSDFPFQNQCVVAQLSVR